MTTTTQPSVAAAIQSSMCLVKRYSEAVSKNIPSDKAACKPEGIECNHATWNFGHMSIYFDNALNLLGFPDLVSPREGYEELFADKTECKNDPDGSIYPSFEEVREYYFERLDAVSKALDTVSDEVLSSPNEGGPGGMLPTVGAFVNFLMNAHNFLHLGQTSTWRRAMGLGPCM